MFHHGYGVLWVTSCLDFLPSICKNYVQNFVPCSHQTITHIATWFTGNIFSVPVNPSKIGVALVTVNPSKEGAAFDPFHHSEGGVAFLYLSVSAKEAWYL